MYLKYIELFGFKTFPEKIRIPFDQGINIIVGPNGCGKTNIVDAIRFILGEQNLKELRLRSMNDCLFSGSNSRGQSSVALCRGVLVNDLQVDFKYKDFSEITAERRHFKNKETEYRINGVTVSYREYLSFFNESNLSRYYSIVDGSKINAILNYKPSDLRMFFEEVSGITKYKAQKKSASKKLESAQINLLRINDLFKEVEKQISSLKSQSELLEKYRIIEKEKNMNEHILHNKLKNKVLNEMERHRGDFENCASQFLKIEGKAIKTEKALAEMKVLFETLNERYKTLSEEKNSMLIDITKLTSAIDYGFISIKNLESEISNKNKELKEQSGVKNYNSSKIENLKIKKLESEKELSRIREEIGILNKIVLEKKSKVLRVKEGIQNLNDNYLSAVEKIQNIKNRLFFNDRNLKNIEERKNNGNELISKTVKEIESLTENLTDQNNKAFNMVAELSATREKLNFERNNLSKLSIELESIKKEKELKEKELVGIDITINRLSDFIEKREGFSEGTKRFLKANRDYDVFPVSDLIEVESGFENVVWEGFEDLLETVVIKNAEDAEKALEFISKDKIGQVKIFIPNSAALKNKTVDEDAAEHTEASDKTADSSGVSELGGVSGFKDLVKLTDKIRLNYADADSNGKLCDLNLRNMGANLYYSKNTIDILNYIKHNGYFPNFNIITEDGIIFLSGGFIIAGKNKDLESQNLLLNKRRLYEYKNNKEEKEVELTHKNLLFEEKRIKINRAESNIDSLNDKIRKSELDESTLKNDIKHMEAQIIKSKERLGILKRDVQNFEQERNSIVKEEIVIKRELELAEENLKIISTEKDVFERRLGSYEDEFEKAKENEVDLKIEINSAEKNLNFLEKDISALGASILNYSKRLENLNKQIDNIQNEILKTKNDISAKQKSVSELNRTVDLKENEIKNLESELERVKGEIVIVEKILETVKKEKNNIEKKKDASLTYINMYSEKLSELDVDSKIYDSEVHDFSNEKFDNLTEDEIKKNIDILKDEMFRIGDVNMNATHEYSEALKRSDFLLSQKLDLEDSIKSLESIIKKLDMVSREKFNSSLKQIRTKFNELFIFLFGGGNADVSNVKLDNSEEIVSDDLKAMGMEINVQIPGKRLTGINVLSQGERVLVAISLLFSIFLTKKTPFCVIDEVDAPLDYANIARYNRLIKEISNQSQIIMVTHNKKTMEIGKNIFGITAKQPGVSKIVSVAMN